MAKITFEIVGKLVALFLFSFCFCFKPIKLIILTVVYVIKFPYASKYIIKISQTNQMTMQWT